MQMNKAADPIFNIRQAIIVDLPLAPNTRILHPEQVMVRNASTLHDLGAFCYAVRSDAKRKPGQPRGVVTSSLLRQRQKQIVQAVKVFSSLLSDEGKRPRTVNGHIDLFKSFMTWTDANGLYDCLAGGDATRRAYLDYMASLKERYARHEIEACTVNQSQRITAKILTAITGLENLARGLRSLAAGRNPSGGTEPATPHDFSHALALNQSLFDGLSTLVLDQTPFPYQLNLPASLGWENNFLWIFPTQMWCLPPHLRGAEREKLSTPCWSYDYEHGCLVSMDESSQKYSGARWLSRCKARSALKSASALLQAANTDYRHRVRIMLGMIAHNAFLFLFLANTGANESVVREIETDGEIDAATLNQNYRSIKFRAQGKMVSIEVPATFMPSLRRFMALRRYLLDDKSFPYLFFTKGISNSKPPAQFVSAAVQNHYAVLQRIDPKLPRWGSKKIRATVQDYYQRKHDAAISARIMVHSEAVANRNYNAGSALDHHEDMTIFLNRVSETARNQKVVAMDADLGNAKPLEEGGRCPSYGHPEALSNDSPITPDCKQGCFFCKHRILVAGEEDARKVASAAFVMEQLILGPMHEIEFRPLILKCDEDLEKIASFAGCREMVAQIRLDVYENGNLTRYFADKYQLFLELGVIT